MQKTKFLLITLILIFLSDYLMGQEEKSFAEKLGYPADARLLIVHADDLGVAHSVNTPVWRHLKKKVLPAGVSWFPVHGFPKWLKLPEIILSTTSVFTLP